jgi:hypothetical protein
MAYTTQELIQILDQELRANWKGERIVLSSAERLDNPVIAMAIDLKKVSKVFAYQDFRSEIHQYQQQQQVSGVVWRKTTYQGKSVSFPEIHHHLIAIEGDKEILQEAKESVLNFWWEMTEGMKFWQAIDRTSPIAPEYMRQLTREAQWAEIDPGRDELYLGLCWGDPKEYQYQWAKPSSGCHRIIAAYDRPSSIKL